MFEIIDEIFCHTIVHRIVCQLLPATCIKVDLRALEHNMVTIHPPGVALQVVDRQVLNTGSSAVCSTSSAASNILGGYKSDPIHADH